MKRFSLSLIAALALPAIAATPVQQAAQLRTLADASNVAAYADYVRANNFAVLSAATGGWVHDALNGLSLDTRVSADGEYQRSLAIRAVADQLDPPVTQPSTPNAVSWQRPFSNQSRWNSQPQGVMLGSYTIPTSTYFPTIESGAFSTEVFRVLGTEAPVTVGGAVNVTLPHWPSDVASATGDDGHADIVDEAANVIHSFWRLRRTGSTWTADAYAWMPLDGTGWGDTLRPTQGVRAVGVPAMAGLIRKLEVNDGAALYRHALAMSLTYTGLSKTFIAPATTADGDVSGNTGQIPEGALLMLPASFNVATISNVALRKVAQTLQTYGGYVVDRNSGVPWAVYAEINSGLNIMPNGWDNSTASDLQSIRAALRQVIGVTGWTDATGASLAVLPTRRVVNR